MVAPAFPSWHPWALVASALCNLSPGGPGHPDVHLDQGLGDGGERVMQGEGRAHLLSSLRGTKSSQATESRRAPLPRAGRLPSPRRKVGSGVRPGRGGGGREGPASSRGRVGSRIAPWLLPKPRTHLRAARAFGAGCVRNPSSFLQCREHPALPAPGRPLRSSHRTLHFWSPNVGCFPHAKHFSAIPAECPTV